MHVPLAETTQHAFQQGPLTHANSSNSLPAGLGCAGRHAALLTECDGLVMLPMEGATLAWRIDA